MRGEGVANPPVCPAFPLRFLVVPAGGGRSTRGRGGWVERCVERVELVLPGPAGREVESPAAGLVRDPAGDLDQGAAYRGGAGLAEGLGREAGGGAGEVERDGGQREPGGVRGELP